MVVEPLLAPSRMGRGPNATGREKTVYERFRRWSADGTWGNLLAQVRQHSDTAGTVDWTVACADSTTTRAHQHAAEGRKGAPAGRSDRPVPAAD